MLSTYSSQALSVLQTQLPDIALLATVHEEIFKVTLITPAGWEFWLDSDEEQLTVGFAEYHCHFGFAETVAQDVAAAASFIKDLQRGKLVLAVFYAGLQYVGSYPIQPTTEKPEQVIAGPNQTVVLKSWA